MNESNKKDRYEDAKACYKIGQLVLVNTEIYLHQIFIFFC